MMFLANVHTQIKHWYLEMVIRYVSFKGGILEKQGSSFN